MLTDYIFSLSLNALAYYQLDHLIPEQKDAMRALILSGGPWSEDQKQAILDSFSLPPDNKIYA